MTGEYQGPLPEGTTPEEERIFRQTGVTIRQPVVVNGKVVGFKRSKGRARYAKQKLDEQERLRLEQEERTRRIKEQQALEEALRLEAEQRAMYQKRTISGQVTTPQNTPTRGTLQQSIEGLQTRGTYLQNRQQEILKEKFNQIPENELRKRALSGQGVVGMSTLAGEVFSYTPDKITRQEALNQARSDFKQLPRKEKLNLIKGSGILIATDIVTSVPRALSGGVVTYSDGTYVAGKPKAGSIAESYYNKPNDAIRTIGGITGSLALGGIGAGYKPNKTLLGVARSPQTEIEKAIVRDLERTPGRTLVIQKGKDAVFLGARRTDYASQGTMGVIRNYKQTDDMTKFVTQGVSKTGIVTRSDIRSQVYRGIGRTKPVRGETEGLLQGYTTRGIFVTPQTKKISDSVPFRGSGFARFTDDRRFIGAFSSRTFGKGKGKSFTTFRGYSLPFEEDIGTTLVRGSGRRTVTKQTPRNTPQEQVMSQVSFIQANTEIQTGKQVSSLRSVPYGGGVTVSTRTIQKQDERMLNRMVTGVLTATTVKQRGGTSVIPVQVQPLRVSTRQRVTPITTTTQAQPLVLSSRQVSGTATVPRTGVFLTSITLPPRTYGTVPIGFIPPFLYSEGTRTPRNVFIGPTGFNFQPSFTALVQNLRGNRVPRRVSGGFDPRVLRRIRVLKKKLRKRKSRSKHRRFKRR